VTSIVFFDGPVHGRFVVVDSRQVPIGTVVEIEGTKRFRIGTKAGLNMVLLDAWASTEHAEVIVQQGHHHIVDTNSTNGTIVNGTRLDSGKAYVLTSGDEIRLGKTLLRYESP
jgi:pSer/pThr/pTyr-binding forkhead associated (FHA) protein